METFKKIIATIITVLKVAVLFLLAVGGCILLVFLILEWEKNQEGNQIYSRNVATLIMIILIGLIYIIALTALIFLFRRIFIAIWTNIKIFGDSLSVRLIGLGITSIGFPKVVYSVIVAPLYLFIELFFNLPTRLYMNWFGNEISDRREYSLNKIFQWITYLIQDIGNEFAKALNKFIATLNITDTVLALSAWILIGQLLSPSDAVSTTSTQSLKNSRLVSYFHNLSSATRQNILLSVIFILSAYLSITAIAAIPWLLQVESSEVLNRDRLQQRLDGTILTQIEFDQKFPQDYLRSFDPFVVLLPLLEIDTDSLQREHVAMKLPDRYKINWDQRIQQSKEEVNSLKKRRDDVINRWNQYRKAVSDKQQGLLKEALDNFETDLLSPMSTQERIFYFQEIDKWFKQRISSLHTNLSQFMAYIEDCDERLKFWINDLKSEIERDIIQVREYAQNSTVTLRNIDPENLYLYGNPTRLYKDTDSYELSKLSNISELQPTPPEPGLGWGPFGWISKWLLRTKSFELALITGMLGFGLFGAAISSFVRGQSFQQNIANLIIRGLSAAIIVFLAVKGGLAIFTVGDQQPNAYVLFFACLVGAVFSEDVWKKARDQFGQNLTTGDKASDSESAVGQQDDSEKKDKSDQEPRG